MNNNEKIHFAEVIKFIIEIVMALLAIMIFFVPMCIIAVAVKLTSPGPVLYWSNRVGRNNVIFSMPKFRSMRIDTPTVATHLLKNSDSYTTKIGSFLRKTSLDELPQLYSILRGDMSFVGPRPALYNQTDLISLRTEYGVHKLRPGLTGWAQINGRDELSIQEKVKFDFEYSKNKNLIFDFYILFLTAINVIKRRGISH